MQEEHAMSDIARAPVEIVWAKFEALAEGARRATARLWY
jgi:hypothetical protein